MGWAARAMGFSAALLGVACAALAGLEPIAERDPVDSANEADASARTDGSAPDAKSDAAKAPNCKKNGDPGCKEASDCCSGQCREDGVCVEACQMPPPAGGTCPFDGRPDCCAGYWCGGGSWVNATCEECVPAGGRVKNDHFDSPSFRSCCSKRVRKDGTCE